MSINLENHTVLMHEDDYSKIMQYKSENEKLRERNKKLEKRCNQKVRRYVRGGLQQMKIEDLESKYNGMIAERNSLIDDLSWYKAKVSRLEREKEIFHRKLMAQLEVNTELRMSNKDKHAILSEFSQHIGNKPSSSTYKYFRAKLDGLGIKEGE
ncbi:hypothetical protein [Staphylococcus saprophyticus]|uniref:hypothetical protein n=1 Tax=Staphylococcus saprophyticus TaxID=29385 RepID=UPI00280AFFE0|nr:hypothetical protein [Staphylococcus saprophyticus]WMM14412.1 hypothetical protein RCG45_06430 [Staphylococcus saprophyticus]